MFISFITLILTIALMIYVLFGGADLGAGILELFKGPTLKNEQQELIETAMAPVWEANHVWLILIVVILFVGFPDIFTTLSVWLYAPLVAIMAGLVVRGCSFAYRHHDPNQNSKTKNVLTYTFAFSSLWTTLWMGIFIGALFTQPYISTKIQSWLNLFSFYIGLYLCVHFSLLASVFLFAETQYIDLCDLYITKARWAILCVTCLGTLIPIISHLYNIHLIEDLLHKPQCLILATLAIFSLIALWFSLSRKNIFLSRLFVSSYSILTLLTWFSLKFPTLYIIKRDYLVTQMTFQNTMASESTLKQLSLALLIGALVILPSYIALLVVFKRRKSF